LFNAVEKSHDVAVRWQRYILLVQRANCKR
jgi:hypothetical protein